MTTVREVALPLATICAPVPHVGDGICDRCHRPPNPPYTRCWSCEQVEGQVSRPCSLIVPISLYEVGLQLHAAIVPIGRVISPEYNKDFWKRQSHLVFDFDVCCVGEHS